jgi:hypothetical protein
MAAAESAHPARPATTRARRRRAAPRFLALRAVGIGCALAIGYGATQRGDSDLTARAGLGYALGIVGLAQMVLLLAYSLRKRIRFLRGAGALNRWFEIHMMLGLAGPTALLFHCNFSLGSLNSSVALFCTLFVAGSGIVGRFLYTRIHEGLVHQRRTLAVLSDELRDARERLADRLDPRAGVAGDLEHFERRALEPSRGALHSVSRFLLLAPRSVALRRRLRATIRRRRDLDAAHASALRRALEDYVDAVFRVAILGSYEWLFGLWHAVHLPLCFLLFASAAVHVVAVHAY